MPTPLEGRLWGPDLSPMKRVRLTLRMRWMLRRWVLPPSGPPGRALP